MTYAPRKPHWLSGLVSANHVTRLCPRRFNPSSHQHAPLANSRWETSVTAVKERPRSSGHSILCTTREHRPSDMCILVRQDDSSDVVTCPFVAGLRPAALPIAPIGLPLQRGAGSRCSPKRRDDLARSRPVGNRWHAHPHSGRQRGRRLQAGAAHQVGQDAVSPAFQGPIVVSFRI